MSKIFANFNLNQSLKDFQVNVTQVLELNNVAGWNGITILEREEKIRKAALILAGQCIGILLMQLSKSTEAKEKAIECTKGWWRKKTKKNGCKNWQILTVGNVIINLKLPYVVEIKTRKDYQRKPRGQGFCPFLRWLGMESGVTPYVWSNIAKYGTIMNSFEIAKQTLKDWGVKISDERLYRLTYKFGIEGLSIRQSKINALKRDRLETGSSLKDKRVIISVDGGRTRVRNYDQKKINPKTKRKKYTGEWIEPKLLTIYTVDATGKKIKNGEVPVINDGTYGNYKKLLSILEMYLVSLGINEAQQILLIADGADWIWQHIPPLLNRLGCGDKTSYLVDFYHATEHLQDFADAAFSQEKEKIAWFKAARKDLKIGKVDQLIEQMKQVRKSSRGSRRKIMTNQINYFDKRRNKGLLNYDKISQFNLPIGSGAVESLIRQAVNLRLKGNK
ncbi:MAG: ISLre2 family transposase [Xenococcaceae cyanobacterium MO_167.B27]|nr:ISLre2 family transposase [Xenococcaceae cyanobacterium MO_167.B27]